MGSASPPPSSPAANASWPCPGAHSPTALGANAPSCWVSASTMFFSLVLRILAIPHRATLISRAFLGLANGNVGIIRTWLTELVREKELQPLAFSMMPLVWSIGSIFGPAFGGALANPAVKASRDFWELGDF